MAWKTRGSGGTGGSSWSNSDPFDASIINDINDDLRTWGGNVDANQNSLNNLAGITGVAGAVGLATTGGYNGQILQRIHHTGNAGSPGTALQLSNGYSAGAGSYEVFGVYRNNFGTRSFAVLDDGSVAAALPTSNPGAGLLWCDTGAGRVVKVGT